MAEIRNSTFSMQEAREAIAEGFTNIEQQVIGIEEAVDKNPHLAFDLAKTLIESTCRILLKERSIEFSNTDTVPKLFKLVRSSLDFFPPNSSNDRKVDKSLKIALAGLSNTVNAICELRNLCGFASHGFDSTKPGVETMHAILVAKLADSIVGFLYRIHRRDIVLSVKSELEFDKNSTFNEYLDETYGPFQIRDAEFRPSAVTI